MMNTRSLNNEYKVRYVYPYLKLSWLIKTQNVDLDLAIQIKCFKHGTNIRGGKY